jgi:hypothetical protein
MCETRYQSTVFESPALPDKGFKLRWRLKPETFAKVV